MAVEFTEKDKATSRMLYQQLMSEQITGRQIYDMHTSGELTPGTSRLIKDYIDLGYYAAEDFLEKRKSKIKENA